MFSAERSQYLVIVFAEKSLLQPPIQHTGVWMRQSICWVLWISRSSGLTLLSSAQGIRNGFFAVYSGGRRSLTPIRFDVGSLRATVSGRSIGVSTVCALPFESSARQFVTSPQSFPPQYAVIEWRLPNTMLHSFTFAAASPN
jgi:hypothetical protein